MSYRVLTRTGPALAVLLILGACGEAPPAPDAAASAPSEPPAVTADAGAHAVAPSAPAEATDPPHAETHEAHDHANDHDTAAGVSHVHGLAELAITTEGNKISARMISPLANFGLSEAEGVFTPDVIESLPGLISLSGGACSASTPVAAIDRSSGQTDAAIDFSWTCGDVSAVTSVRFDGFAAYPGFEVIKAVFLSDVAQTAGELTPAKSELALK